MKYGGFPSVEEGSGTVKKIVWGGPVKKLSPKCIILGTSGVIWVALGIFWSDFSDLRLQNQSVL